MAYTADSFLRLLKPYVLQDMKNTGILASLTAAQAFIESSKGNSDLTRKANNLFGIKGEYNGQYVVMKTTEYINHKAVKVDARFRKYPSWLESISDHSRLLSTKRYAKVKGETNYKLACKYVEDAGYATAENPITHQKTYAETLTKTIEKYKLYEWDKEVLGGYLPPEEPYNIGEIYATQQDLYIRDNPNGKKVKFDDITEDAKRHAKKDLLGYAILLRGTRVTCKAWTNTETCIWMQIPSGWICASNSKHIYVL